MSSMDWLDRGSPDSMNPAYRIHFGWPCGGSVFWMALRTYSATDERLSLFPASRGKSDRRIAAHMVVRDDTMSEYEGWPGERTEKTFGFLDRFVAAAEAGSLLAK